MSLYVCNGNHCEPNENCAIRYPGIGECHLTQDIKDARKPIVKYYQLIEMDDLTDAVDFLMEFIDSTYKDAVVAIGFDKLATFNLYEYCVMKGYSYDFIMVQKLNDIAKKHDVQFRFTTKSNYKKVKSQTKHGL